jgi:hypothetical protein
VASILENPREFTKVYLRTENITVNERGELQHESGKNTLQIFDTMYLDYLEKVKAHNKSVAILNEERKRGEPKVANIVAIQEKVLQKALSELITEEKIRFRAEVIAQFKCSQENLAPLLDFILALTGKQDPADVAVLAHWLWQVKVKMLDRSPSYHLMPIFYGKQEGGKTVALNKLIGPINNFRLNINLDQMGDDRYFRAMSENYVIVFDEMQGAQRADIDALKKQVTIDYNDYRPLGTNEIYKVRQSCSFIGATNRPVSEQIVDSTGMRRFWQLNCMDKLNWDLLNSIDYIAMWQGINEARQDGYVLDQINNIRATQEDMVAKDDLQMYLEIRGLLGPGPFKRLSAIELYKDYKEWALDNGHKPLNSSWWARKLGNRGIKSKRTTHRTTNYTYYEVPIEANLPKSEVFDAAEEYSHLAPVTGTKVDET